MSYKIWPTAAGYCIIDSETGDAITDSMDKRAAMRLAYEYNINGEPIDKVAKVVEEPVETKPAPKKRGRKKAE